MGFGLILVGLAFLTGVEAGFGVVGYALICMGCMRLAVLHDDFKVCAYLSLLNIPYTLLSGLDMFGVYKNQLLTGCLNVCHYVFSAVMFWYFCMRIRAISLSGDDEKLASSAIRNGLMAVLYYIWTFAVLLIPLIRTNVMVGVLTLFKYALIVLGILFLLSCGAKITTASQMQKEQREAVKPVSVKKEKK